MMTLPRALLVVTITAYSLVASAQEPPQPVVRALNSANAVFVQHWNKQDAPGIAAFFTENSLFVAPAGTYQGKAGVQQYYETLFPAMRPSSDFSHDIDHVQTLSADLVLAVGHWGVSRPALKGFWSAVYEHQGETWVMRSHTYNITPPAAATQGGNTSSR